MIGRCNASSGGGGGSKPFAMILVNYPAGSTVTCTNTSGQKDITSTQRLYYVKSGTVPFNCVVTATDGTHTKSQTVAVTYEGQGTVVTLSYSLVAYDASVTTTDVSMWSTSSGGTLVYDSTNVAAKLYSSSTGTKRYGYLNTAVDLTEYSTITFEILDSHSVASYSGACGVSASAGGAFAQSTAYALNESDWQTITVDVSALTGNYYIEFSSGSGSAQGAFCRKITLT